MIKFVTPIILVIAVIAFLVSSAVEESSKKVLTVESLVFDARSQKRIRVGARVATSEILVTSGEVKQVSFFVVDPLNHEYQNSEHLNSKQQSKIKVIYHGLMPDTLKEGRDVIMEGDYIVLEGEAIGVFNASTLNTQCPSKYQPPKPS